MKTIRILTAIAMAIYCTSVFGQASLAAENMINDIKVTTKYGQQKVYTVFREARPMQGAEQWYYMPNELRLAEQVDVSGKVRPKVTILRYQHQDVITKAHKQGGILVGSFTYAIEPEVINQVKNQIRAKRKLPNNGQITLSAIPFNTATVDFLAANNEFVGNLDAKMFSGATTATQEMVLCYNLSDLGASVMSSLLTSSGGLPIRVSADYNGLSAPCGIKIEGDWSNVYEYFEQNTKVEGRIGWGWFGFGASYEKNTVRESLTSIKNMKVNMIECNQSTNGNSQPDPNMEEIIKLITNAVFSDSLMNRAGELAQLQSMLNDPLIKNNAEATSRLQAAINSIQRRVQIGMSTSIKDVQRRRTGKITYDYTRQRLLVRSTTVSGILSLAKYKLSEAELIKAGHIIDLDANQAFPSVVIGLPKVSPDMDVRSLVLEVSYKNSNGQTRSEARTWNADQGEWLSVANAPSGFMRFNLIGETNKNYLKEPTFKVKLSVISKLPNASFVIEKETKLTGGERYIDALELLTKMYIFDAQDLDFYRITSAATDLTFAKLSLTKGSIVINKDLKPALVNGIAYPPNPLCVLMPKDNNLPDDFKIIYTTNTGTKVNRMEPIVLGENTLSNFEWK